VAEHAGGSARQGEEERDVQHCGQDQVVVVPQALLSESLAVVGRDGDGGRAEEAVAIECIQ
jgi:hypothetical protein